MPKYLSLNYLQLEQTERRSFLELTLIPLPSYIEFVENYVHNGDTTIYSYLCPWKLDGLMASRSEENFDHLFSNGATCNLHDNSLCLVSRQPMHVECFDFATSSDLNELSCSFDNDNQFEDFSYNILHDWEIDVYGEPSLYLLELIEVDASFNCHAFSKISTFLNKLKPKMLQDPFLNEDGDEYNYHDFTKDHINPHYVSSSTGNLPDSKESFTMEQLQYDVSLTETLLESPLSCAMAVSPDEMTSIVKLKEELMELDVEDDNDLFKITNENFPPQVEILSGTRDNVSFVELNEIVGITNEFMEMESLLLESPTATTSHLHITDDIDSQVAKCSRYPLESPDKNTFCLLRSSQQRALLQKLQRDDNVFDNILSLTLQYPYESTGMTSLNQFTVHYCMELLETTAEIISGDDELNLPWDPLSYSVKPINLNMATLSAGDIKPLMTAITSERESYDIEELVVQWLDGRDAPLDVLGRSLVTSLQSNVMSDKQDKSLNFSFDKPTRTNDLTSPLDMFLLLRAPNQIQKQQTISSDGQAHCLLSDEQTSSSEDIQTLNPFTIQVPMTEDYIKLINKLNSMVPLLLPPLRQSGIAITADHIAEIPFDTIKFYMKQLEKTNLQSQRDTKVYATSVVLYILKGVVEEIINSSILAALDFLVAMVSRYDIFISRDELLENMKCDLHSFLFRQVGHPKMHEVVKILNRKPLPNKVVIVLKKYFLPISQQLTHFLAMIPDFKVCCVDHQYDGLGNIFQQFDCLVISETYLYSSSVKFPDVDIIVEYDGTNSSISTNKFYNIGEYFILQSVLTASQATHLGLSSSVSNNYHYVIIVSEAVIANSSLLTLLEGKYDYVVIERNLQVLREKINPKICCADIVLDASTGVVIHQLKSLSSNDGLPLLVNRLYALSLQFDHCFLILYFTDSKVYNFSDCVQSYLGQLHASLAHFAKTKECNIRVLLAFSAEDIVRRVKTITDWRCQRSSMEWINRSWLTEQISKQEIFLLSFPCINPMSAQFMLRQHTLKQLLSMSFDDLSGLFPMIPRGSLQMFHLMCNLNNRIHHELPGNDILQPNKEADYRLSKSHYSTDNHNFILTHDGGDDYGGFDIKFSDEIPTVPVISTIDLNDSLMESNIPNKDWNDIILQRDNYDCPIKFPVFHRKPMKSIDLDIESFANISLVTNDRPCSSNDHQLLLSNSIITHHDKKRNHDSLNYHESRLNESNDGITPYTFAASLSEGSDWFALEAQPLPKVRRLGCEKISGRIDGQTKLVFK